MHTRRAKNEGCRDVRQVRLHSAADTIAELGYPLRHTPAIRGEYQTAVTGS